MGTRLHNITLLFRCCWPDAEFIWSLPSSSSEIHWLVGHYKDSGVRIWPLESSEMGRFVPFDHSSHSSWCSVRVDLKQDPRQTQVDVSSLRAAVPHLVCKQPITLHYRGQWGFDLFRRRLEVKSRYVTFIYVAFFTMHTVSKRLKGPDHQISCTGKASACAQVQ